MTPPTVEQFAVIAKANVEKLAGFSADNTEALTKSGNAAMAGFTALAKAYQDLTSRNFAKLTASVQALSSVKTPQEFFEVQQKLAKESFQAAVSDSRAIAELTTSVFTAAFEPMQKQVTALQNIAKKAA